MPAAPATKQHAIMQDVYFHSGYVTVIFLTAVTFIPLCCKKLLARLLATQVVLAEKKFIYLICSELRPFLRAGCTTKPLQQCTQRASC